MLAMQDYMKVFLETFEYPVEKLIVHYCTWGHFYMKPTNVWTSMVHWVPKGTQVGGTGKCRGRCPFGSIGDKGKWVHEYEMGQESHMMVGGKGRKSNKGAAPLGLHRETWRVRQAKYKVRKK